MPKLKYPRLYGVPEVPGRGVDRPEPDPTEQQGSRGGEENGRRLAWPESLTLCIV